MVNLVLQSIFPADWERKSSGWEGQRGGVGKLNLKNTSNQTFHLGYENAGTSESVWVYKQSCSSAHSVTMKL